MAFWNRKKSKTVPTAGSSDQEIIKTLKWSLIEYGISPSDPVLRTKIDTKLMDTLEQLRSEFIKQETKWLKSNLPKKTLSAMRESRSRRVFGHKPSNSESLVARPFDYIAYLDDRSIAAESRRLLFDRGIEVASSPVDQHFLLMTALSEARELMNQNERDHYLQIFANNRTASDKMMIEQWGELPPGVGQELVEEYNQL